MYNIQIFDKSSEKINLVNLLITLMIATIYLVLELTLKDNPINAVYALIAVALSAIILAVVLWIKKIQPESGKDNVMPAGPLGEVIDEWLPRICTDVRAAAKINAETLSTVITKELNTLAIDSERWSRGELHTPTIHYQQILLELYKTATSSIYSTTTREYIDYWQDDKLLTAMIAACDKPHAVKVIRIFVFKNKEEIDSRAIEVINRFIHSAKIVTLVSINEEIGSYKFENEKKRDFAVIDGGEAIGITDPFDDDGPTAIWYFGNKGRKRRYAKICHDLELASKPAAVILKEL